MGVWRTLVQSSLRTELLPRWQDCFVESCYARSPPSGPIQLFLRDFCMLRSGTVAIYLSNLWIRKLCFMQIKFISNRKNI